MPTADRGTQTGTARNATRSRLSRMRPCPDPYFRAIPARQRTTDDPRRDESVWGSRGQCGRHDSRRDVHVPRSVGSPQGCSVQPCSSRCSLPDGRCIVSGGSVRVTFHDQHARIPIELDRQHAQTRQSSWHDLHGRADGVGATLNNNDLRWSMSTSTPRRRPSTRAHNLNLPAGADVLFAGPTGALPRTTPTATKSSSSGLGTMPRLARARSRLRQYLCRVCRRHRRCCRVGRRDGTFSGRGTSR